MSGIEKIEKIENKSFGWFVFLVAHTKKRNNGIKNPNEKKKQTQMNRTVAMASVVPLNVLELMNVGEEEDVVSSALKIVKSSNLFNVESSKKKGLRDRFEIISIFGPVEDETTASILLSRVELKRGSRSRTCGASILSRHLALQFSMNVDAILGLSEFNLKSHIVNTSMVNGTTIYVYTPPKKKEKGKHKMILSRKAIL